MWGGLYEVMLRAERDQLRKRVDGAENARDEALAFAEKFKGERTVATGNVASLARQCAYLQDSVNTMSRLMAEQVGRLLDRGAELTRLKNERDILAHGMLEYVESMEENARLTRLALEEEQRVVKAVIDERDELKGSLKSAQDALAAHEIFGKTPARFVQVNDNVTLRVTDGWTGTIVLRIDSHGFRAQQVEGEKKG